MPHAPHAKEQYMATTPPSQSANQPTSKDRQLDTFSVSVDNEALRTNQGVKVSDNQNTLKAGARGPSLLEDFIMREKITHFDHERIPERIVHARGAAAHGYFQPYASHTALTKAGFLADPATRTPVYVRFSTVQGSRGSADTVRDVRGFAVKFYTDEGNFDLVGNNMPVFFIQDAIKFPDFVHAVKPEPHNEMPQGATAHDTFWDFVTLVPETTHMVMWAMSDRGIPQSYRLMEGFGIHTFRFVNAEGKGRFVKFHWRPVLGSYSLIWDEAQKLSGKDPDFHRRDLWEAIEAGNFPEWEFGVQIVEEEDEHAFAFDLLDPTKIIPEELVPITMLGKMTLNRNPDNYFAETEQVAFCPGHIVPGLDFSNDPLLQGRLFSYTDTQISRLGGPNFHELPINRPVSPNVNNQRDAMHRQVIHRGQTSYEPNSISGGWPKETPAAARDGGFETYPERIDAAKIRERSTSFGDHYSQATLFWNSMSDPEKDHIVASYQFELSKVEREYIRQRMVDNLANVDPDLAARVGDGLGLIPAKATTPGADVLAKPGKGKKSVSASPSLSLMSKVQPGIKTTKIAILAAKGADPVSIATAKMALEKAGAQAKVIAPMLGEVAPGVYADATIAGMPSIAFDAVFVACGADSAKLLSKNGDARHYLLEAYKHLKAIAAVGHGRDVLAAANLPVSEEGVISDDTAHIDKVLPAFIDAIAHHRVWGRAAKAETVPA
ncbi:catalase HPII [Robbsia andropogonis]|uniref:catalase HPII n=1 Tax=Robbsia andropogonis TaxID=28092 RepID=UPI000465EFD6|nr:catalase HPII [Robbsia andropogonis]